MSTAAMPKAFAVWFSKLERWNVDYFRTGNWLWPREVIKKLNELATVRKEEVLLYEAEESKIPIIQKINFSGELFLRPLEDYGNYKGKLFKVFPGDLIFSKINVKKGCIYFHSGKAPFLVSNEYPVLKLNPDVLGEYLNLVLQTDLAKEQLSAVASGMAKVRTHIDDFLNLTVPFPPLPIQQKIINYWQNGQEKISQKTKAINDIKSVTEKYFFDTLGLKYLKNKTLAKSFALQWTDIERWGVNHNQMKLIASDLTKGKYPVVKLGSVLERMQYGTSEKASKVSNGIPIVRMNNIINGKINFNKLKYLKLTSKVLESLKLKKGDILINRTNSKELVGKCAVFDGDDEYVFASYLIRLNTIESALPDYIAYIINSSIGRQQINAISRQIIGQANINTQEISDLDIILPPLNVQKEIMRHIFEKQKQIQKTEREITGYEQLLKNNIESVIIGGKKIAEVL